MCSFFLSQEQTASTPDIDMHEATPVEESGPLFLVKARELDEICSDDLCNLFGKPLYAEESLSNFHA